jgi:hypothetical protein
MYTFLRLFTDLRFSSEKTDYEQDYDYEENTSS